MSDGYKLELPEGVSAEALEFVGGEMEFRLEPIAGTPFSKLVAVEGSFRPFGKKYADQA